MARETRDKREAQLLRQYDYMHRSSVLVGMALSDMQIYLSNDTAY